MKTFKTPKGTELPIMDIKGKDYLQAAPRIVWLREEHPDWSIQTEFLVLSDKCAVCKATISQKDGQILATATSMETIQGFESFVEKAETCAISRAAAFCGYGTLMAQELEEQGKLAESPINARSDKPSGIESPMATAIRAEIFASEAQVKRLTAIQLKARVPDAALKAMASGLGISSRNEIPKDKYNTLCALVENYKA